MILLLLLVVGPIYHVWLDSFQVGVHHHMSDKVVQDCGLSREAAASLQNMLDGGGG
jgi:hypothetical protein